MKKNEQKELPRYGRESQDCADSVQNSDGREIKKTSFVLGILAEKIRVKLKKKMKMTDNKSSPCY